jgi:hypothetical protein
VLVPATDEVRQAENTFEVDLAMQPVINFSFPTITVHVGQAIGFDSLLGPTHVPEHCLHLGLS